MLGCFTGFLGGVTSTGVLAFLSLPFLCFSKPLFRAAATASAIAGFLVGGPSSSTNSSPFPLSLTGRDLFLFTTSHGSLSEDEEISSMRCSSLSIMVVMVEGLSFGVGLFGSFPLDGGN